MIKELFSPCDGEIINIEKVQDPVFSQKMLGNGIAIIPSNGKFVAPCDGEIKVLLPSKHVVGIINEKFEILIHIGFNTVELKGEGFKCFVKKGQIVKKGDPLIEVDLDFVKKKGYVIETPIVFPENQNIKFKILKKGKVNQEDKILDIT